MGAAFRGFPPEGLRFLKALKRNNRREWFQPRKQTFEESVKAPLIELVTAVNAGLARFAPDYVTDPKKAVFRIYRDTRFSRDKSPYKTQAAAVFVRRGMPSHTGGMFYFHISPREVEIAGGVYQPEPETMRSIRNHIAANHEELLRLAKAPRLRKVMGELKGSELTRVPKGFAADHPAAALIRKKDWIFDVQLPPEAAAAPGFEKELLSRFRPMLPFLEYMNRALAAAKSDPPADYW